MNALILLRSSLPLEQSREIDIYQPDTAFYYLRRCALRLCEMGEFLAARGGREIKVTHILERVL